MMRVTFMESCWSAIPFASAGPTEHFTDPRLPRREQRRERAAQPQRDTGEDVDVDDIENGQQADDEERAGDEDLSKAKQQSLGEPVAERAAPSGPSRTIGMPAAMVTKPTELFLPVRSKASTPCTTCHMPNPSIVATLPVNRSRY